MSDFNIGDRIEIQADRWPDSKFYAGLKGYVKAQKSETCYLITLDMYDNHTAPQFFSRNRETGYFEVRKSLLKKIKDNRKGTLIEKKVLI